MEYQKREKHVCGHPFQHCCIGQCRQLSSKLSAKEASVLYAKWNLPLANLSTVLDYMGQHNIPCNLWIGMSLSGDQAIGALCELMRDAGYELDTTTNHQEECVAYANWKWAEGRALNCSRTDGKEVGQPSAQYYRLVHPSYRAQQQQNKIKCPVVTIAHSGIGRIVSNESYQYLKRGGVMIWNHGVHCNKRGGCIANMMNQSIAPFVH